jgi:hypothetical protein
MATYANPQPCEIELGSGFIFRILARLVRRLGLRIILHAVFHSIFQRPYPFAQTFSEFRQFFGTEHQQGDEEYHQQVHRLKQAF